MKASIVFIQSVVRSYLARKSFLIKIKNAIALQANIKARLAREQFLRNKEATLAIQVQYRSLRTRYEYLQKRDAAEKLQSAGMSLRYHDTDYNFNLFFLLSSSVRAWLARREIEECCAARRRFEERIVKLQSLWRGYKVRKQNNSEKMRVMRQRIARANATVVESMKLGNRTLHALEILLSSQNLTTVLKALESLGNED